MRITYLHQYFNTPAMSGSVRSYEMSRRLVAKGHVVNMVTSWRENDGRRAWFRTEEAGVHVHWLPVPYSNHMGYADRLHAFWRFAWSAAIRAASLDTDVVLASSTPLTIALPAAYAARRRSVPMVFEVRDLWPDVPVAMGVLNNRLLASAARRLERFAYRSAARIVALTPTMRDFISGKGVDLERISTVSNGSDLDSFGLFTPGGDSTKQAAAALSQRRTVLYCGSLGPAHGPEYLVRLAEELLHGWPHIQILVVGDGRLRETLEQQAGVAGCLGRTIHFAGSVARQAVPQCYLQADASLMTMAPCELLYRHSVQNKFFDSLAAGKPVFANYSGWASDLAESAGAGVIIPYDDVREAARILAEKLDNRVWLEKAGQAARRLAEDRFDPDRLAAQLEEVLLAAVESRISRNTPQRRG